jgi:hypothetical protein
MRAKPSERPAKARRPLAGGGVACPLARRDRTLLAREQAARAEAEAAVARLRAIEHVTEAALANLPPGCSTFSFSLPAMPGSVAGETS